MNLKLVLFALILSIDDFRIFILRFFSEILMNEPPALKLQKNHKNFAISFTLINFFLVNHFTTIWMGYKIWNSQM